MNTNIKSVLRQICKQLESINPELIVLFGSYAYGKPHTDSDIDLLVVTDDKFIPQSFKEQNDLYLSVSNQITDIAKQYPIDLIVHTLPVYRKFREQGSNFAYEIITKGKILYERYNKAVA